MDVNIHDKRGQDAITAVLGILAAVVGGILLFGLMPGILLTSFINYFFYFTPPQLWGLSLILSIGCFWLLKLKVETWTSTLKKYSIIAVCAGLLLGLASLFIKHNFTARTIQRMFGDEERIPYKYLTAPSETLSENRGRFAGLAHNQTFDSRGTIILDIYSINQENDSVVARVKWEDGLFGSYLLAGVYKNGVFNLQSVNESNEDVESKNRVTLTAHVEEGKMEGTYKYYESFSSTPQNGIFTCRNIRKDKEE